ncbi:MAG: MOSC domain-containing protein [Ignavibacteria bacterium]
MAMVILFAGGIRPLPPENEPTGMFKRACEAPVWLGSEGLAGDAQADRRVHGGPYKALHQYPVEHYARLARAFPSAAAALVAGSLGENLSVPGWNEDSVAVGDVFRLGDALVQVTQPRSPCWKIDRRHGVEGMTRFIAEQALTGWYFRVLEEGEVAPGCGFECIERPAPQASVRRIFELRTGPQADRAELEAFADTPGLTPGWADKLRARARGG